MTPLLAHRPRADRGFERIYRKHVADVYHYALAVLHNAADAEDVTQTTFLNAYRAYERGERPQTPHNWLIAIAHNVCRQRFRQSQRRPQEVEFIDEIGAAGDEEDGPTAEDIRRALRHLAFNQRAAIVMRELEGRSYAEIAEILGLSVSAVETLLFRARQALREQLEGGLTCRDAELAISKQIDGRLPRRERGALRAHLRECPDCATFARSQRAQRSALKALAAVPLPSSLASLFGGGGATAVGTGLAVKAAAVVAVGIVGAGVSYEGVKHPPWREARQHPRALVAAAAQAPTTQAPTSESAVPPAAPPTARAVLAQAARHSQPKHAHRRARPGNASHARKHAIPRAADAGKVAHDRPGLDKARGKKKGRASATPGPSFALRLKKIHQAHARASSPPALRRGPDERGAQGAVKRAMRQPPASHSPGSKNGSDQIRSKVNRTSPTVTTPRPETVVPTVTAEIDALDPAPPAVPPGLLKPKQK